MADTSGPVIQLDARQIPSARGRAVELDRLIKARPTDDPHRFDLPVPEGVEQGRGAWGGVATGAMTSAAMQVTRREDQVVRTMSAQLIGPLTVGWADVRTEILREGSATTTVAVRVHTESGDVVAHGVVVLGAARVGEGMPTPEWGSLTPPVELAAGPSGVAALPVRPPAPDFLGHVEIRPVTGVPFTGSGSAETSGWLQPIAPVSNVDEALLVALADAWWGAVMPHLDRPRPVATIGFACELAGDPGAVLIGPDGRIEPLFHKGRMIAARAGYTVETRELWTASGQLLTWNTQTVAVIK